MEKQGQEQRTNRHERENKSELMTMHSAKGLEFETGFLIQVNEG